MNVTEKKYYLRHLRDLYQGKGKKRKGEIICEVISRLTVSRKHAIRLMQPQERGRPKKMSKRGRPSRYGDPGFKLSLKLIWKVTGFLCSRALKEAIPEWLPAVERRHGVIDAAHREKLLTVSAATMDRILKPYKGTKGKSFTRSGGFLDQIPIQTNLWDIKDLGHIETDTVAHCGGSMLGEFVNSVTTVDIASIWTECDGVWGRSSGGVFEALKKIESELPFPILSYDADNGGEVMNETIHSYFIKERLEQGRPAVFVARSRAYHKNDNAHVEQRNDAIPRKYLGYDRLGFKELTPMVSCLYRELVCPLHNHFIPCFKLSKKEKIKSRFKRMYDKPVTPYRRLMQSSSISKEAKKQLKEWHNRLDPVELKSSIFKLSKQIDAANKKLMSGQPLTDKDLKLPEDIIRRPIFDERPLVTKALRQSASQYGFARELHKSVIESILP